MKESKMKAEYENGVGKWEKLRSTMFQQLDELFTQNGIILGVPMESRVKSWDSIQEKFERKVLVQPKLTDLDDLVGARAILLFKSDLAHADKLIRDTFQVLGSEDTAKRLNEAQFGYQSQHYTVCLPKNWLEMPSLSNLGGIKVEIQVRTLAQHVWAVASHKLQYKHEQSVPPPLRRTINRISALLETVDLEFDRVLEEKKKYLEISVKAEDGLERLNVDNLASIMDGLLPVKNKKIAEPYEEFFRQLTKLEIKTAAQLKAIWNKHKNEVLLQEASIVGTRAEKSDYVGTSKERIDSGVFNTHVGLMRRAILLETNGHFQKAGNAKNSKLAKE